MKHTEPGYNDPDPSERSGDKDSFTTPETARDQGQEYTRAAGSAATGTAEPTGPTSTWSATVWPAGPPRIADPLYCTEKQQGETQVRKIVSIGFLTRHQP